MEIPIQIDDLGVLPLLETSISKQNNCIKLYEH